MSILSSFRQRYIYSVLLFGLLFQSCNSGPSLCAIEEKTSPEQPPLKKMKLTPNVVVPSNPTKKVDLDASAQVLKPKKLQELGYQKENQCVLKAKQEELELLQEDKVVLQSHIEYLEQQNSALRVRMGIESSPDLSVGSSRSSDTSRSSATSDTSGSSATSGTSEGADRFPDIAFGRERWSHFFNCDTGEEPPLPTNIDSVLDSYCSFWPNKKVRDTHLLILIPRRIDGRSFTLDGLSQLTRCDHLENIGTKIWHYDANVKKVLGLQSPTQSYWTLVTRDVVPVSQYIINADQSVSLSDHLNQFGYVVSGTLEMATAILSHYVRSNECLYSDASRTYARCQEYVAHQSPAVVGGLSPAGLQIYDLESAVRYHASTYMGVACSRKL
jgi:hypothetical protein